MTSWKCFIFLEWMFLIHFKPCISQRDDYWSDDFDQDKNCENQEKITKLSKLEPSQCKTVPIREGEEKAFSQCKTHLTFNLQQKCEYSKVDNPGYLNYCKKRGQVTCCFGNQTCASWWSIQNAIYANAKAYLKDKRAVLNSLVKSVGYKTCHHLETLDASKCAEDCKNMEKENFATNCTSNGGLFKCCIRRDKRSCHECRFCCTLPMCTKEPGGKDNTEFDGPGLNDIKLESQKNDVKANDIFFSDEHIYKSDDYHCLKPDSHKDPRKWHKYEMESYRNTFSSESLKNVQTFKYDNYLYNFVDPKVFKSFTNGKNEGKKHWKKSYGFQYVNQIPGVDVGNKSSLNATACIKKCIKIEKSRFARYCGRDGGYFKCCITFWILDVFEKARNNLIKDGLIKDKQEHVCKPKSKKNPCLYCSTNGICTKPDPFTGEITQLYYPKNSLPSKGRFEKPTSDLRFNWCLVLDICKYHKKNRQYFDRKAYQEATNKEEVCAAGTKGKNEGKDEQMCSRLYTRNIFQCSEEEENVTDSKILLENKKLISKIKHTKMTKKKKRKNRKKKKKSKKKKKARKRKKKRKDTKKKRSNQKMEIHEKTKQNTRALTHREND